MLRPFRGCSFFRFCDFVVRKRRFIGRGCDALLRNRHLRLLLRGRILLTMLLQVHLKGILPVLLLLL